MNKKVVAAAVASALAMPMAAQAVKYSASGQVNRAIMVADDGQDSDVLHVDGDASSTRFRFTGSEDLGNGLTAGVRLEIQCESNDSFSVDVKQNSDTDSCASLRHAEAFFSGDFGKLSLGQSSDATDGIAFADLNNAWIPVENASDFGGGIDFLAKDPSLGIITNTSTLITAGDVTPSYDGGRRDRVRYDTPSIGPLSLAVSHATDSRIDVGAIAAGSAAGGAYDLRVGWNNTEDGLVVVSGGFKFAQGTFIGGAWGQQSFDDVRVENLDLDGDGTPDVCDVAEPTCNVRADDGEYFYIKLGHDWGNNSVAVDWKSSENAVNILPALRPGADDDDVDKAIGVLLTCGGLSVSGANVNSPGCGGTSWGLGAVHTMPKANIDLYAGYRFFELEDTRTGVSVEDISVFFVGSRVKFD